MEKFLRIVSTSDEDLLIPISDIMSVGVSGSFSVVFLSGSLHDVTNVGEVPVLTFTTTSGPNAGLNATYIIDQLIAAMETSWQNPIYTIDTANFPATVSANTRDQVAWAE